MQPLIYCFLNVSQSRVYKMITSTKKVQLHMEKNGRQFISFYSDFHRFFGLTNSLHSEIQPTRLNLITTFKLIIQKIHNSAFLTP